jgi:hypothetical protein
MEVREFDVSEDVEFLVPRVVRLAIAAQSSPQDGVLRFQAFHLVHQNDELIGAFLGWPPDAETEPENRFGKDSQDRVFPLALFRLRHDYVEDSK